MPAIRNPHIPINRRLRDREAGDSTEYVFDDGRIATTHPFGTYLQIPLGDGGFFRREEFHYLPQPGFVTRRILNPDQSVVKEFLDGSTLTHYPHGTKVSRFPDGTVITEHPDGSKVIAAAKGQPIFHPAAHGASRLPEGVADVQHLPGNQVKVYMQKNLAVAVHGPFGDSEVEGIHPGIGLPFISLHDTKGNILFFDHFTESTLLAGGDISIQNLETGEGLEMRRRDIFAQLPLAGG